MITFLKHGLLHYLVNQSTFAIIELTLPGRLKLVLSRLPEQQLLV